MVLDSSENFAFYTIMLITSPDGLLIGWVSVNFIFQFWRQLAYKTKQCFLTRRLTDALEKKNLSILGWSFFFFPQSNYLPGTRTWTSSIWRTNPKRSHEVLNGRNRDSGAQTPARWERGRKQRCSNASVQHRLKKKKTYRHTNSKPALRN